MPITDHDRLVTRALQQFQAAQAVWNEVQPLEIVRTTAQRLLRVGPLRAAGALLLAAALVAADHRPQSWEFVCLDARLGMVGGIFLMQSFEQSKNFLV